MIVRQFLQWVRTAPAGDRAEATSALARAYLYSDLSRDDRAVAEGAMIMLLDDSSPMVRRALAHALASSPEAPPAVIHALANDIPDIAAFVLGRSSLFLDAELVDHVAVGDAGMQMAIADREFVPASVSAALAEVGCRGACLALVQNPGAEIARLSFDRLIERFGSFAEIREALLARDDLHAPGRYALIAQMSQSLAEFATAQDWLRPERADVVTREARERATVELAAMTRPSELRDLVMHLRESGTLTAGLILRALLSGNVALFEEALADLADLPIERVSAIVYDRNPAGFRALYNRAGLPQSSYPAFGEAVNAIREAVHLGEPGAGSRLKRRMIERVLTRCAESMTGEIEPYMTLLRRFATEAAREEARLYCDEIVADDLLRLEQMQEAA